MRVHPRYDTLWIAPAFLEYVHEPITPAAIRAAEKQLGVALPRTYLAMLSEQNGGYLRGAVPDSVSNTVFGIGGKFPSITRDAARWRARDDDDGHWAPEDAAKLIPFDGDGHWHQCFDYRERGVEAEPSVTFVDSESQSTRSVAESFDAYLAAIVDETAERALRLYDPSTAETVARRLAAHLAVAPPTVDRFSYGYDTWRLSLRGTYQWCWIHANVVPRGFRREKQRVIVTDETTVRVPEDPACHTLVSCTDGDCPDLPNAEALRGVREDEIRTVPAVTSRATVRRALEALGLR